MTAPGWYETAGDPPGTQRWWDGNQWVGTPVPAPAAPTTPMAPHASGAAQVPGAAASAGSRFGARLIDLIIMLVILVVLIQFGVGTPEFSGDGVNVAIDLGSEALDAPLEYGLWGIISFAWSAVWIATVGGTPGKKLAGLRIVEAATGQTPSPKTAVLRSINKLLPVAGIISVDAGEIAVVIIGVRLIGFISLVLLNTDQQRRTVMDRLSSTRVVRN